jgi:hypothetical protein
MLSTWPAVLRLTVWAEPAMKAPAAKALLVTAEASARVGVPEKVTVMLSTCSRLPLGLW